VSTARANLKEDVSALLDARDPGTRARLAVVVRAALGAPEAEPLAWRHAALPAGYGPATAGTFRVSGTARLAAATVVLGRSATLPRGSTPGSSSATVTARPWWPCRGCR
jgi:hypothetical protein